MKYWVFIGDSVQGPYTIKEIVEKNFISSELLVCPSEMPAAKPSSWYFAKELAEFDPYISKGSPTAVKEIEVEPNIYESEGKIDFDSGFGEIDIDEIVKNVKNKIDIEVKKDDEYTRYRKHFEKRISEIDEKIKKAFALIERYEKSFKEKDALIERLEREIECLKRSRDEERKIIDEKMKEYEERLNRANLLLEEIKNSISRQKDNEIVSPRDQDDLVKKEELSLKEEEKTPVLSKDDNLSVQEFELINKTGSDFIEGSQDAIVEEKKSSGLKLEGFESYLAGEKSSQVEETLKFQTSDKQIETVQDYSTATKPISSLAKEIDILDNRESFEDSVFQVNISSLRSSSYVNDDLPFQTAEINLESVSTNLDVVVGLRIEPLPNEKIEESVKTQERDVKFVNKDEGEKIEKIQIGSNDISQKIVEDLKTFEKSNETISPEITNTNVANGIVRETDPYALLKPERIEKEDVIREEKNERTDRSPQERRDSLSVRKRKNLKITLIAGFSVILFFFALVYILRSGRVDTSIKTNFSKREVDKKLSVETSKVLDNQPSQVQDRQDETLEIAKINENVRRAIDIVKSYNLGEGKGTIERWLSNTMASNVKGKEEWNATYLSGNIFVVQYRFLRFKSEPIVYLFEVDVEKGEIVRGINNNAINLLAGNKNNPRGGLSKVDKKVSKHIEKDDEIF